MWDKFLEALTEQFFTEFIPILTLGIVRGFFIFVIGLSAVYLLGRMLGFVQTYRQKNLVGFITMAVADFWLLSVFEISLDPVFEYVLYLSFAIMWYVLLGFRLYDRADKFLDKKIAKD